MLFANLEATKTPPTIPISPNASLKKPFIIPFNPRRSMILPTIRSK